MIPVGTLASASVSGVASPTYTLLDSDADAYGVSSPISQTNMWDFIGATYGAAANFVSTNVVAATGHGNVISQHFPAGIHDGLTLAKIPLAYAVDEATIEYDFRFVSTGTVDANNPWGLGGKLPGLAGILPSQGGNPPSGNTPSIYGWSGRNMWITPAAGFSGENPQSPAEIIGYIYDPLLSAGSSGRNRRTGVSIFANTWYNIKVRYVMNSINVEGVSGNANGIHQIWVDGVLEYSNTAQVWRIFEGARITALMWSVFYGGPDDTWAADNDADVQIDNMLITTPIPPPAPAEPTPLQTGFEGTTVAATMDGTAGNQNSPTNDLLTLNTNVGTPTRQYVSADVCNGTRALRVTAAASSTWRFYYPFTQSATFAMRTGFQLKALPTVSNQIIWQLIEASSFSNSLQLVIQTDGQLRHINRAGTQVTISGFTASLNTAYRIEAYGSMDQNPTSTNGTVTVKVFAGNSTTASVTFSALNYDLGTVGFIRSQWGKPTSAGTLDIVYDDLAVRGSSDTPIGPAA